MRILIVGLGDNHRVPLAYAAMKRTRPNAEILHASLLSYQAADWKPGPPGKKIRQTANNLHLDLRDYQSGRLTAAKINMADAIVFMDAGNRKRVETILAKFPEWEGKLIALGPFAQPPARRIAALQPLKQASALYRQVVRQVVSAAEQFATSHL